MIAIDLHFKKNSRIYCACVESDNFSFNPEIVCNSFSVVMSADNTQLEVTEICNYITENWANILNKFEQEYESKIN